MSKIKVIFYKDDDSSVPVLDWLEELPSKAVAKCLVRIERLSELGHELRRPEADFLRDKIYELRIGLRGINYRILYFFHGDVAAVLAHGIVKENAVPPKEIERAIERRKRFETHPEKHTHTEEPQYEAEIEND
ncbi:MAG: type II toxin-antitoxin system RelE/ParE family toxin [Verrucomicrobia bacterium]|nr:type II toxin-antitoxin system RelE/ParE family toxin [Verrucomicrobiota bacterium]